MSDGYAFTHIGDAAQAVVARVAVMMEITPITESPIEVMFGGALLSALKDRKVDFILGHTGDYAVHVIPQYIWKRYRMDWAIRLRGDADPRLFVECDGKEWHSSDAQIARDRRKDSEAASAGIQMFRFSGSDIYRSANACAGVVLAAVGIR